MTIAHIFYIPVVALAGMVLGFIWGRKAAISELRARERLAADREARRRARASGNDA